MKRILSAVVFLPVFWAIVRFLPPAVYHLLIATAGGLALFELFRIAEARGLRCHRAIAALVAFLLLATFVTPRIGVDQVVMFALIALPAAALRRGGDWGRSVGEVGASLFVALFTGLPFGYMIGLREVADAAQGAELGADLVLLLMLVVWGSDTAAYYTGTRIGRRPLAPTVSPKKTIEGAAGGIAGALAAAFLARAWFMHRLTPLDCVLIGAGLGAIGLLGDLVESMFKRGAGCKDSATLVPGHGGILDRVDSLLYAAPALYYYYLLVMEAR
jgi:phosphatidate cytidylyltransferase